MPAMPPRPERTEATDGARRGHGPGVQVRPDLERARDLLVANLDRNLPVARLAEEAGLSAAHFARQFRRAYGLPPRAFQRQLRVRSAQRLIADGRALADVALAVGFYDQSHLNRTFRALLGRTPGAQARGGNG